MRARWRGLLLAATLSGACAYYNGLYNANRLAGDARRAEREGRAGEARSFWAQAAVKAESVAIRHPTSKYRDDALLLWGQGLAKAGGCDRAIGPLGLAVDSSPDPAIQRDARLALADCLLGMREAEEAVLALEPLLSERDSAVVVEARYRRGLARLRQGNAEAAVEDLQAVPPELGAFDLARAYLALGEPAEAERALGTQLHAPYDETRWMALLDSLGTAMPEGTQRLVDTLTARGDLTTGQRARLLLADGMRWAAAGEPDRSAEQFRLATSIAPDSAAGRTAEAHLAIARLRGVTELDSLDAVREELDALYAAGGPAGQLVEPAANLANLLHAVLTAQDSTARDVRLFLLGEMFRDSLRAPRLASEIFLRLARDQPESAFAPKALLASAMLDPARADSAAQVIATRYAASPYALALEGRAGEQFTQLEDSLGAMLKRERQSIRGGRFTDRTAEEERGVKR